jgi:hypothetical protein
MLSVTKIYMAWYGEMTKELKKILEGSGYHLEKITP